MTKSPGGPGQEPFIGCRITVRESLQEGLGQRWRALLADGRGHVFQTWEWNDAWMRTIGERQGVLPRVVELTDADGTLMALWPLGIYRRCGLRVLAFLGDVVSDYRAPVFGATFPHNVSAGSFEALWASCLGRIRGVDLVDLTRMPVDIDGIANPMAALRDAAHTENAYAVDLPETPAAYFAGRPSKLMADTRRQARRLAELGQVAITPQQQSAADWNAAFAAMVEQKSRRWQETDSRDLFAEPGYLQFYKELGKTFGDTAQVSLCNLWVGEVITATQWGMIFRGRYYWILPTYLAGEWGKYSCGRILLQHMIEWAIGQKLRVFDLTVGDEAYKKDWATSVLRLHGWRRAMTLRGRVFLGYLRLKQAARSSAFVRRVWTGLRKFRNRP
ncbi:GNAT family N-acetyltransferase [Pigmentiphaga humi]|uniref:GNAT family N-acetyltransferase n=1 Tax=Pigmentiphaga humi TaxID=2478468 RepID=UPI001357C89F|nr:GNAT family N-acetyltransferase [Pigmentiphaga humi]